MTDTPTSVGTYEDGIWFLDREKLLHRLKPAVGVFWKLNTFEYPQQLRHTGPGQCLTGCLAIESVEELTAEGGSLERRCLECFPAPAA